jgi:DNA-binding NtrC family response regulator
MDPRLALRVLVVDDEEDFQQLLTMRLTMRGYDVVSVGTGEQALASLSQRPAELVVLDMRLPGMDGLQTLEHIKQSHPATQVIMLTGYADPAMIAEVQARGVFAFMMKPVLIGDLIEKIQQAQALSETQ